MISLASLFEITPVYTLPEKGPPDKYDYKNHEKIPWMLFQNQELMIFNTL